MKRYEIQHGNAPKEVVGQDTVDRIKARGHLDRYTITELPAEKAPAKPAELGAKEAEPEKSNTKTK